MQFFNIGSGHFSLEFNEKNDFISKFRFRKVLSKKKGRENRKALNYRKFSIRNLLRTDARFTRNLDRVL